MWRAAATAALSATAFEWLIEPCRVVELRAPVDGVIAEVACSAATRSAAASPWCTCSPLPIG